MKRYEPHTINTQRYKDTVCDTCGQVAHYPIEVVISVNQGEEGGQVDEYDYCDDCFMARIPALEAAGSRAPIVVGNPEEDQQ